MSENDKYKGDNTSSPYNFKQNVNKFFDDLANLSFKNVIKNERLSRFPFNDTLYIEGTDGIPVEWTSSVTGNHFEYINAVTVTGSILAGENIKQDISINLSPNKEYTMMVYCNTPVSGLVIGMTADNSSQIFNSDPLSEEVNSATVTAAATSASTKYTLQFTTNATTVSGAVYIGFYNTTGSTQTFDIKYISVYEGSIEVAETTSTSVDHAVHSTFALSATYVTGTTVAASAIYAGQAGQATLANYATSAGSASYATSAGYATYSGSGNYATNSGSASYATSATYVIGLDNTYSEKASAIVKEDLVTYALWFNNATSGISCNVPVSSTSTFDALAFNATSKREYKERIEPVTYSGIDLLNTVDVVSFRFKEDQDKEYKVGFIADDTNPILAGQDNSKMDIGNCIGILIKAVQELSNENKLLREMILTNESNRN